MDRDLLKFLFNDSFEPKDELDRLFEGLARLEALEVDRQPLDHALKKFKLGDHACVDVEGLFVSFSCPNAYQAALHALFEPDGLATLAELGYVPVRGDGTDDHRVFFIRVGEAEPDNLTPDEAAKAVAKEYDDALATAEELVDKALGEQE